VRLILEDYLNSIPLNKLWQPDSPIWYRPTKDNPPIGFFRQIVGHTPPGWLDRTGLCLDNYISVDPYSTIRFDKTRYRYSVVEDGKIELMDSNKEE